MIACRNNRIPSYLKAAHAWRIEDAGRPEYLLHWVLGPPSSLIESSEFIITSAQFNIREE